MMMEPEFCKMIESSYL